MMRAPTSLIQFLAGREHGAFGTLPGARGNVGQLVTEERATIPTKNQACEFSGQTRSTFLMAFSPDGTKMASTHGDHAVRVTDLSTGKCMHTLKGHPRTPWCVAFHPTANDILATGCLGGEVRIWDLRGGGSEVWQSDKNVSIASIAFHPQEQVLVFAVANEVHFWDWTQPQPFATVKTAAEYERVRWVRFDPSGYYLYTGIGNAVSVNREEPAEQVSSQVGASTGRHNSEERAQLQSQYRRILDEINQLRRERLQGEGGRHNINRSAPYRAAAQLFPSVHGNQGSESTDPPEGAADGEADETNTRENPEGNSVNNRPENISSQVRSRASELLRPPSPVHVDSLMNARMYASSVTMGTGNTPAHTSTGSQPENSVQAGLSTGEGNASTEDSIPESSTATPVVPARATTGLLSGSESLTSLSSSSVASLLFRSQLTSRGQPERSLSLSAAYSRALQSTATTNPVTVFSSSSASSLTPTAAEISRNIAASSLISLSRSNTVRPVRVVSLANSPSEGSVALESTGADPLRSDTARSGSGLWAALSASSAEQTVMSPSLRSSAFHTQSRNPPSSTTSTSSSDSIRGRFYNFLNSSTGRSDDPHFRCSMGECPVCQRYPSLMSSSNWMSGQRNLVMPQRVSRSTSGSPRSRPNQPRRLASILENEVRQALEQVRSRRVDISETLQDLNNLRRELDSHQCTDHADPSRPLLERSDSQSSDADPLPNSQESNMSDDLLPSSQEHQPSDSHIHTPGRSLSPLSELLNAASEPSTLQQEISSSEPDTSTVPDPETSTSIASIHHPTLEPILETFSSSDIYNPEEPSTDVLIDNPDEPSTGVLSINPDETSTSALSNNPDEISTDVPSSSQEDPEDMDASSQGSNGSASSLGSMDSLPSSQEDGTNQDPRSTLAAIGTYSSEIERRVQDLDQRISAIQSRLQVRLQNLQEQRQSNTRSQGSVPRYVSLSERIRQRHERLRGHLDNLRNRYASRVNRARVREAALRGQDTTAQRREALRGQDTTAQRREVLRGQDTRSQQREALRGQDTRSQQRAPEEDNVSNRWPSFSFRARTSSGQNDQANENRSNTRASVFLRRSLNRPSGPRSGRPWAETMEERIRNTRWEMRRNRRHSSEQQRSWHTMQRRHLHPHYSVSILDETVNRSDDGLQAAINRAIAGAIGDSHVATNIINTSYRIQRWEFSRTDIPDIKNNKKNVIVPHCKLHNDAYCDVSQDGNYLAVFVPSHNGFPDDSVLAVFSLAPHNFKQCIFTKSFGPNFVSVSISPLNNFVLVGLATRRLAWVFTPRQMVAQVYKLKKPECGEDSMEHVCDLMHPCDMDIRTPVSVNSARWMPFVGEGIVYGTNRGDLHICQPGFEQEEKRNDTDSHQGEAPARPTNWMMHMLGLNMPRTTSIATQTIQRVRRSASTQTDTVEPDEL